MVFEVAREVISLTGRSSPAVSCLLPEDGPRVRCSDIWWTSRLLEWAPQVSQREGLTRAIADRRARLATARLVWT